MPEHDSPSWQASVDRQSLDIALTVRPLGGLIFGNGFGRERTTECLCWLTQHKSDVAETQTRFMQKTRGWESGSCFAKVVHSPIDPATSWAVLDYPFREVWIHLESPLLSVWIVLNSLALQDCWKQRGPLDAVRWNFL